MKLVCLRVSFKILTWQACIFFKILALPNNNELVSTKLSIMIHWLQ